MAIAAVVGQIVGSAALGSTPVAHAEPTTPRAVSKLTTMKVSEVAATDGADALPDDAIAKPGKRSVARADELMVAKVHANGAVSDRWAHASADLSKFSDQGSEATESGRSLLRPFYVSAAARPLDQTAERNLSFRLVKAGGAGLWQLGSTDAAAEPQWADKNTQNAEPKAGGTYALSLPAVDGGTLSEPSGSPAVGAAMTTDKNWSTGPSQQWTMLDAGDGWFRLVSVADGLCLSDGAAGASTGTAVIAACEGDAAGDAKSQWQLVKRDTSGFGGFNGYLLVNRSSGLAVGQGAAEGSESAGRDQIWQFTQIYAPGGVVPTWSVPAGADVAAGAGMAAGDLDDEVADDQQFHDEAAVAFVEGDHQIQIRVIDYADGKLGETAMTLDTQAGGTVSGGWRTGSLNVTIGDFAGDEGNEVAVTYQNAKGEIRADILRYTVNQDGSRSLKMIAADQHLVDVDTNGNVAPSLITGMVNVTAGDFDGAGRDELAAFYGAGPDSRTLHPRLNVISFDAAGKASSYAVEAAEFTHTDPNTLTLPSVDQPWISRGPEVAAGLFTFDPKTQFGMFRRELAVAWSTSNPSFVYDDKHEVNIPVLDVNTYLGTFTVDNTAAGAKLSLLKAPVVTSHTYDDPAQPTAHQFPLALTVGGLRGIPDGPDPALDGAAVSDTGLPLEQFLKGTWQTHLRMFDLSATGDIRLTYQQASPASTGDLWSYRPGAYDRSGRSVHLGAPLVITATALHKPTVIAAEPPAHSDWLNGDFVNVSRSSDFAVTMTNSSGADTTTTHTTKTSSAVGVTEGFDTKATFTEGVPKEDAVSESVELKQKLSKEWESEQTNSNSNSTSWDQQMSSSGSDDDIVDADITTYRLYRYPIIGAPVVDASGSVKTGSRGVYEVAIAGKPQRVFGAGKAYEWYQPSWQNGNALSYPQLDSDGQVPVSDNGSYTYQTGKSTPVTKKEPLFQVNTTLGGLSTSADLDIAAKNDSSAEVSSTTSLANSGEVTFGIDAVGGFPGFQGKLKAEASIGFDTKSVESELSGTENSTTTGHGFMLEVPQIDESKGYAIGTTYYYDQTGVAKVEHGVNLLGNKQGRDWWNTNYSHQADLALNLPLATTTIKNALGKFEDPKWSDGPSRQQIRGFYALQPVDPANPASSGQPYTNTLKVGDKVDFQVQVHNYSLHDSQAATAKFYAVPVDDNWQDVTGEPVPIGEATVLPMAAQGMTTVTAPEWTAKGGADGPGLQNWRIFTVLDSRGQAEIHPLTGGKPCEAKNIIDGGGKDAGLIDPMTGEPETLACGQNNQGYGEVTVNDSLPQAGAKAASVDLDGASLVSDDGLDTSRGIPTAVVGEQVRGVVHAKSDITTGRTSDVLVYDGNPDKGGKLVAATTMAGVDASSGGHTTFTWQPTTAGRHTLYQQLYRADGTVDEQKFVVKVLDHDQPERLVVKAKSPKVTAGTATAFTATTVDQYGNQVEGVTAKTRFAISPNGSCKAARCTATKAGGHTVTATYRSMTATTKVTVKAAKASKLKLTPARATVVRRHRTTYTVKAYDRYGNLRGNVTTKAKLSITPNGTCRGATCWASKTGKHKVKATYGKITTKAVLTVRRR